jgi:hypothetical protein
MVNRAISLLLLALPFSFSCHFSQEEIFGTYVSVNYVNTADTIWIKPNGLYLHRIYTPNGQLLLDTRGEWKQVGIREFKFSEFFLNYDRDLIQFPELLADTLGSTSVIIESHDSTFEFCTGYLEGEYCYRRVAP